MSKPDYEPFGPTMEERQERMRAKYKMAHSLLLFALSVSFTLFLPEFMQALQNTFASILEVYQNYKGNQ